MERGGGKNVREDSKRRRGSGKLNNKNNWSTFEKILLKIRLLWECQILVLLGGGCAIGKWKVIERGGNNVLCRGKVNHGLPVQRDLLSYKNYTKKGRWSGSCKPKQELRKISL